jgi:uncharacterized protein (TIGR00645 family)
MKETMNKLPKFIFWSRWLQAPLYVGLVLVLGIYVYEFGLGLVGLLKNLTQYDSTQIMIRVLDLIDVVMIANLLIMVIVGGYETFVSRLNLHAHPDQPEWLDEVNAGTMKIKLAIALISISSIHLLRTFITPVPTDNPIYWKSVFWQVIIHLTLVASTVAIALTQKLITQPKLTS